MFSNHRKNCQVFGYISPVFFVIILLAAGTFAGVLDNGIDHDDPDDEQKNERVILGVLAQFPYKDEHQFIAASYVKYLESAGARVVPLFSGYDREYYREMLTKLNGVLLPGGGSPLNGGPYAEAVDSILDQALEFNKNNDHFPVWATCLSFEKMLMYFMEQNDLHWQTMCHVQNVALNLEIEPWVKNDSSKTQMFRKMNETMPKILSILEDKNVTAHYHRVCIDLDEWNKWSQLAGNFNIISLNHYNNHTFVSTIEHRQFPIFGSIWHPEKNQFEWAINQHVGNINHDQWAIVIGQYFGNFLVNEARKNCHHFENKLDESKHLISNYNQYLVYTGNDPKSSYDEVYRFPLDCNEHNSSLQQQGSIMLMLMVFLAKLFILF